MKLYPFIKANYWRSGSVGIHNKILIEARAGRTSWDVVSQTTPVIGQTVFFNGDASRAPAGHSIVGWTWDFGDGTGSSAATESSRPV